MADEKAQMSTQQSTPPGDESSEKLLRRENLLPRVEEVSHEIDKAIDSNLLSDAHETLHDLSKVLSEIKSKLTAPEGLPESKRKELHRLLPDIEQALRQLKQPQKESSEPDVQKKLLVTGCNPFNKLRSPSSQDKKSREQGGGQKEEDEAVSLKLLVHLARHVLEPEQYYEWTTSYVDESRIYGWDKDAGLVMDALIDGDEGEFRAAAITGIHGSGKTALAQKVFVHEKAKDHFPIRLWVCVGPPTEEDRFNLLYRMLDNLGLDTNKVEDVFVDGAVVVKEARKKEEDRIRRDEPATFENMKKKARDTVANNKKPEDGAEKEEETAKKADDDAKKKDVPAAGVEEDAKIDEEFNKLLKQKLDKSPDVQKSKIGVLLYILHMTLSKTGYLIVFDDIRVFYDKSVFGDDGWYSNLTLPPPPQGEWSDRLAYGLPKNTGKHRNAVLITCRKEDDAKTMVRTGRVFRPPELDVKNGWKLFEREYKQAKELKDAKQNKQGQEDLLFKELEEMQEEIVTKCLGLPVAIIEAAKGFALSDLQPLPDKDKKPAEDDIGSSKKGEGATDDKPDDESK